MSTVNTVSMSIQWCINLQWCCTHRVFNKPGQGKVYMRRKQKIERTSLNHTSVLFFRLGECTSYLNSNCRIVKMYPLSTLQRGRCTAPGGTIHIENCENYAPRGAKYDDLVSVSQTVYTGLHLSQVHFHIYRGQRNHYIIMEYWQCQWIS